MSAPAMDGMIAPATAGPLRSLRATARTLSLLLALRALLAGACVLLAAVLVASLLALVEGAPAWPMPAVLGVGTVAGLLVAVVARRRAGPVTGTRAALWVEERVPSLDYALVTAADPRHAAHAEVLASRAHDVPWGALRRAAARRALLAPSLVLVALATGVLVVQVSPAATAARVAARAPGGVRPGAGAAAAGSLARVGTTVRPPAYTRLPARREDDATSVAAVVGSAVELDGRGAAAVRAALRDVGSARPAERALAVRAADGRWRASFTMPATPGVVRLADGLGERLVLLEPRPDSAPVVVLDATVRDTVLREPAGRIALAAEARDDFGVVSSAFEWIVSSGEGESYTFRNGTVGEATHGNARTARLQGVLALDALQLKPGDIVHVRAVARDGNGLSGPGVGASETRTIRIARQGEYDSLAVEGAPPPALDTTALSQRMLLVRTERLEARRPRPVRDSVLGESRRIAVDQTRLRKRVGELVYMRLGDEVGGEHAHFPGDGHEHGPDTKLDPTQLLARASAATGGGIDAVATDFHGDETPVVAVNRPLLDAYNHMWDASRALEIGEPAQAIPPMRRALEALQRARDAERIYLRGRPPTVVVDLARVRLTGKDRGAANVRGARAAVDDAVARRARRFERALVVLERAPGAAIDSLLVLRLDALAGDLPLAAALDEAVRRLRGGEDATEALLRARRAAAGAPVTRGALSPWSGGGVP